ncbi:MAG: hypothetical protein CME62_13555 [Halobacteriovoraceae bacterium]|nr:hypothetical protein [Halobacteriovoraceae bacterium]|tara:strand:+ start:10129 stop:10629 length:501 start_codon:yes stop_codon:yes gene_type:complete
MTLKSKLVFSFVFFITLATFTYSFLVEAQVSQQKIKGRILKIEKIKALKLWKLYLFSEGDVIEIDIKNKEDALKLKKYNKKYIHIVYNVYLTRGFFLSKNRLYSWRDVNNINLVQEKKYLIDRIDHNLTCSLLAELKKNKELNLSVEKHLKDNNFNINDILAQCSL